MSPSNADMIPRLIEHCQFCGRPFQYAEAAEGMERITCQQCKKGYQAIFDAVRVLATESNHKAVRKILRLVRDAF